MKIPVKDSSEDQVKLISTKKKKKTNRPIEALACFQLHKLSR